MGAKLDLRQVTKHPENCEVYHRNNLRHAEGKLDNVGGLRYNTHIPTNERQQMLVEHNLKFVTEFADNHPVTAQVLNMDEDTRIFMLESMLKELLAPRLQPILDEINAGGTYAILKVAE